VPRPPANATSHDKFDAALFLQGGGPEKIHLTEIIGAERMYGGL
jgi:hypothetical protein